MTDAIEKKTAIQVVSEIDSLIEDVDSIIEDGDDNHPAQYAKVKSKLRALKEQVVRLSSRSDREIDSTIRDIHSYINTLDAIEAKNYITVTFNSKFFAEELDAAFKKKLAHTLWEYGKSFISWDYDFLKQKSLGL